MTIFQNNWRTDTRLNLVRLLVQNLEFFAREKKNLDFGKVLKLLVEYSSFCRKTEAASKTDSTSAAIRWKHFHFASQSSWLSEFFLRWWYCTREIFIFYHSAAVPEGQCRWRLAFPDSIVAGLWATPAFPSLEGFWPNFSKKKKKKSCMSCKPLN